MTGAGVALCNAMIKGLLSGYYNLCRTTVLEALESPRSFGKPDTLNLDAIPELAIASTLHMHDPFAVVITEESGARDKFRYNQSRDPRQFPTVFLCDPIDRSSQFKRLLERDKTHDFVREVLQDPAAKPLWEEQFGTPASITGPVSAVTCVQRGMPICSVILNYVTGEMVTVCSAGIRLLTLAEEAVDVTFDTVFKEGKPLYFPSVNHRNHGDMMRFVTFLGKETYPDNLKESKIIPEPLLQKALHYGLPGGPMRPLYLSDVQADTGTTIGFILSNGEKIGEWIHWLTFVRFARTRLDINEPALKLFEVYHQRPLIKDKVLMATPPPYSIFRPASEQNSSMVIDVSKFADYENPSKIRSTLIITSCENIWATGVVERHGDREILFDSTG